MTNAAFALDFDFPTISNDNLDAVTGGVTREEAQSFGGQVAEVGAVAGGAALGTALGGPGGAAAGAAAGEIANRTGASNAVGRAVGGAVYDGVSAVGNAASSAWSWGRRQLGY